MKTAVIRIANSRGVRVPKALLAQCRLHDAVELGVENGRLVIRPADQPRRGRDEAFSKMAERGDDVLLDEECLTTSRAPHHVGRPVPAAG